jgi:hypothetical protein
LEIAAAELPREPAVEAPTDEASELRWRLAALDELQGEEAEESQGVDAPAAEPEPEPEPEEAPAGEDADLPDEPVEAAEVKSPPIVPVDLDEGRPPIDIEAADLVLSRRVRTSRASPHAVSGWILAVGRAGRYRMCRPLSWRW